MKSMCRTAPLRAADDGVDASWQRHEWNKTAVDFPDSDACLHELIERQAWNAPERVAVVCEHERITYRELVRRGNIVAQRLLALGAAPDVRIGLLVERSVDMIVGILGILKAGAAYVPIDPGLPAERVAFMLADSNAALLVSQSRMLAASAPPCAIQSLCLDTLDWSGADVVPMVPAAKAGPANLAYVIYTSGSTGRPKGVAVEHRNIVNYSLAVAQRLRFVAGMNHATVSTIAADLGNTVVFPALITGGCLHIMVQERCENQGLLAEYFERERIDVLKIVPSHLQALQSGRDPHKVMPRQRLILGGEASRLEWIARLRNLVPDCEIYNHYGPTETTVGVLTYPVGMQLPATGSGTLPIGRPLPNCRAYIVDAFGQPVPIGERGELCIGGRGVSRGYLNRPELTAEKFVADPFSADPGSRMYRTGDLARYLADGSIEFCGRTDDQVKLHGYRIELGEIQTALRAHPGVRDAVVLAQNEPSGDTELVAYVVPRRTDQVLWDCRNVHVLPDGSPIAHLNRNETDYIYKEIFVLQAYRRHGVAIRDGDCVVDAGANIGLFTVFANRVARKLRMYAFEPNPAAYACLQLNAAAWGPEVKCLQYGLSSENTSAELTFFEGLSLLSGFHADAGTEREVVRNYVLNQRPETAADTGLHAQLDELIDERLRSTRVKAELRTLSSVIEEERIDRIDLLKINVEKSELQVLLGLRPQDWPKIRQMVVEVDLAENVEPIAALLETHGFDFVIEQDPLLRNTELCYIYARQRGDGGKGERRAADAAQARSPAIPVFDANILTPASLRRYLSAHLPHYMVPAAFMKMDKLPLTANGKIDRSALPPFSHEKTTPQREKMTPPSTETEQRLAEIWSELLKVKRVAIDDDFFDLGGQSMQAIQVVSRIRDAFGVNIPLRNLFEHPTLAGLAQVVDRMRWLAAEHPSLPVNAPTGVREEIEI